MNTEKCSQHFPRPQDSGVHLNVPGLNNVRIYEKKSREKTPTGLKAEVTQLWTGECGKQMNAVPAVCEEQRHLELRGCSLGGLSRTAVGASGATSPPAGSMRGSGTRHRGGALLFHLRWACPCGDTCSGRGGNSG